MCAQIIFGIVLNKLLDEVDLYTCALYYMLVFFQYTFMKNKYVLKH